MVISSWLWRTFDLASFETFLQLKVYIVNIMKVLFLRRCGFTGYRKIGFACEKQGRPSEMLKMYYENIEKFGNDPKSVGVDEILKKYTKNIQNTKNYTVRLLIY